MDLLSIDKDHKIIVIDSINAIFPTTGVCDFYINLDEPLRNVYKIKILASLVNIKNNSSINHDLESIYIDLNNYNRIVAKGLNNNNIYYFDSLIIENAVSTGNSTIKNDYNNADIEYSLNPIEPQITRFRVQLFNKNNVLLSTSSDVNRYVMKLGIYYNNKKSTRL